eukprot:CAMPEP_0206034080 /NCGR_PEP_ID=MMETSP1466-20131121/1106_1 /ASSEMBLY_ACC=CAM_ASM_001126 /TAXON_ID=44452 /ORGANISM="Pavlova gyrans, Strain CCMP608" /LENGTH=140 /DNA_ID=CAMNT_0053408339 /DNA_START=6 /DNA_END=424 /DNA_ORIENTATION=+
MESLDLNALQQALDKLREEKQTMQRERMILDKQKQVVQENIAKFRDRVKLDVGGVRFSTTRTTLCRFPDSMLGTMFSGREGIDVPIDDDGHVFIDRDGAHFGVILNFLRTGKLLMPKDPLAKEAVRIELDFYLLKQYVPG